MPIHEYKCECESEKEIRRSFRDADLPQICECGKVMQHKISLVSFVMKPTGRGMALDTLNNKKDGLPNKRWKAGAEQAAASGV